MSRKTPEDWIAAGFRALTQKGPQALKAEPLARDLKTTKGSFYWHFKDVPTFQAEMLACWEKQATQDIIDELESEPDPEATLRALSKRASEAPETYGGVGTEPAIRAWAKADETVRQAVERVDAARLTYLAALLDQMKLRNPDLPKLYYAGLIGLQELAVTDGTLPEAPLSTLTDMIIALSNLD